ncbi:MAG: 50S ribosomal protein L4 [Candidatus Diapherotrites archaeon]
MKAKVYDTNGKEKSQVELPKEFSAVIREDVVAKVLETKKKQQPYSPSPVAGKQHSAKGKVRHKRHVWRSGYGRGQSRVPRKIFSRKGSQFIWQGAEVPQARGGMRAHPPKVVQFLRDLKINKKELRIAFESALSSTANEKYVLKKYSNLEKIDKKVPLVLVSNITELKIKELLNALKNILGKELFGIAIRKKSVRAGKGKLRGRKYKSSAGMLFVLGNNEKLKTNAFEVKRVKELNVFDLAKGGLGRLTIYTEKAIRDLGEKRK